jgi:predicted outer membrane protein
MLDAARRVMRTISGISALLLLATTVAACTDNDDDNNTQNPDGADVAVANGNARGETLSGMADEDLGGKSQPMQIAMAGHVMITIDTGEVMQAQLAVTRCRNADVCAFAQMMIDVHTAHMGMVQAMLRDASIEPVDNRVSMALRAEAMTSLGDLRASANFDMDYMTMQVTMHEEARVIVQGFDDQIDVEPFQTLIRDTVTAIVDHRNRAVAILRSIE